MVINVKKYEHKVAFCKLEGFDISVITLLEHHGNKFVVNDY